MFTNWPKQGTESRASSLNTHQLENASTTEIIMPYGMKSSTSSEVINIRKEATQPVNNVREETTQSVIAGRHIIYSVAFVVEGKYVVSGDDTGKIRRWDIKNGGKVGEPMDAGSGVRAIAVTRDGQWMVVGTWSGQVTLWNTVDHKRWSKFTGHTKCVNAVDFSPDGTKIVTGSRDNTACVWSLQTGQRILGPLTHVDWVVAAKFSPGDGTWVATATWQRDSVRVYNSQTGDLLFEVPIKVNSPWNQSLAWATHGNQFPVDNCQLFALSGNGVIHCLKLGQYKGPATLSKWLIHSSYNARCIALESTGTVIVASSSSSISFWDTTTHQQVRSVIKYDHDVWSMAISNENDLVVCGNKSITLIVHRDNLGQSRANSITKELPVSCEVADLPPTDSQQLESLREIIRSLRADLHAQGKDPDSRQPNLNENAQQPYTLLSGSEHAINQNEDRIEDCIGSLRAILRARDEYFNNKITSLEQSNQYSNNKVTSLELADQRSNNKIASLEQASQCSNNKIASLEQANQSSNDKISSLEQTNEELSVQLTHSRAKTDLFIRINHAHECRHTCEYLYSQGRVYDAAKSLLEIESIVTEDIRANMSISDWLEEFSHRCITALESVGDDVSNVDKAQVAYSTALSLSSSTPNTAMLTKWAKMMLANGSAEEALRVASKFKVPRFAVYRTICCVLEESDRLTEAADCFRQMHNEVAEDEGTCDERAQWEQDFCGRCAPYAERLGDAARESKKLTEAITHYSTALKFDPINSNDILLKRSNGVIELDPSSHRGWEEKHAALHAMGHYSEAFGAFRTMLSKLAQSPDPQVCELRHRYVDATSTIQEVVEEAIRDMPRVLIDTVTGHLYDKTKQAAAFEELPIFDQLRSSMTTMLDYARIRTEVKEFYHYVMLSHRWQPHEPTFQMVEQISVYSLPDSPAFRKLRNFCKLVQALGFKWAWSDTCCVNQLDKAVQQESLVAMFRWYRGSSLTVVHILGVFSESQKIGCLWKSIWNTRGWTYQEYLASEVVQFYTEDWKPYLGLDTFNHKESPVILSEMERAMNFKTKELATLQPGLDRTREKLYLASRRQTTREEDMAYSLFGIFNVALPVIYGEGDQAVGRLLEHIVTRSDDVTLLAWTGSSGSHHSYLPSTLTVYDEIVPPHLPAPIKTDKMDDMVAALCSGTFPDPSVTVVIYERFYKLPPLSLDAGRLRLPCIIFPVVDIVRLSEPDAEAGIPTYSATSSMLGDVNIRTRDELSGLKGAFLIHPWIGPLLDQDFSYGEPLFDLTTRALQFFVRLRQPFGALLLVRLARAQYRRIAADCLIKVQVRAEIPLTELVDGIDTIDIQ